MEQTIELLNVLKWTTQVEFNNLNQVLQRNEVEWKENIYFVCWLKEKLKDRCNDDDIYMKKYFVVDIDIRLDCFLQTWFVLTNDELINQMETIVEKITEAWLDDYSALVHSGNGLHIYYTWTERAFDKVVYSSGVKMIYELIDSAIKSTWYRCDPACHNIARIMRLPWTLNPRKKEVLNKETKVKELAYDLWPITCEVMHIEEKQSKLFEDIEKYGEQYIKEKEQEREDSKKIHQLLKADYKKPDDVRWEINNIPACDIACDLRPVSISDKGWDHIALKEHDKNMGAYWYRPTNVIVNTGSSLITTNKSYFTSYELVFYEYANQDKQKTLDYFEQKHWIKFNEKNWIVIPKKEYVAEWFYYPWEVFAPFDCVMSGELVVVIARSNSGKTSRAMNMIMYNVWRGKQCFYINLEFPIETMRKQRWLYTNWYTKKNLTDIAPLPPEQKQIMDDYVATQIAKFDNYSNPQWLELDVLVDLIIAKEKEWYKFFVIDTFSRITGNLDSKKAHSNQNKSMEVLQELCQNIWIVILLLHHTNKTGEFEWSQKIMDLSNVFISIEREEDDYSEPVTKFILKKDKFASYKEIETTYRDWEYVAHM